MHRGGGSSWKGDTAAVHRGGGSGGSDGRISGLARLLESGCGFCREARKALGTRTWGVDAPTGMGRGRSTGVGESVRTGPASGRIEAGLKSAELSSLRVGPAGSARLLVSGVGEVQVDAASTTMTSPDRGSPPLPEEPLLLGDLVLVGGRSCWLPSRFSSALALPPVGSVLPGREIPQPSSNEATEEEASEAMRGLHGEVWPPAATMWERAVAAAASAGGTSSLAIRPPFPRLSSAASSPRGHPGRRLRPRRRRRGRERAWARRRGSCGRENLFWESKCNDRRKSAKTRNLTPPKLASPVSHSSSPWPLPRERERDALFPFFHTLAAAERSSRTIQKKENLSSSFYSGY